MPDSLDDIDSRIETFRERYLALNASIRQQAKNLDWATENTVVLEHGAMSVRRFHDNNGNASPVLVVYSHVNSPHVIDLQEEVSLVRRLQECGNTVYLLDWGDISENDRENDLSVYVLDYVTAALEVIRSETGVFRPALLGVCQGGTFALCYACAFSDRIRRLALLVTPVDFHAGDSVLTQWSRFIDFKAIEKHPVNIPGAAITTNQTHGLTTRYRRYRAPVCKTWLCRGYPSGIPRH